MLISIFGTGSNLLAAQERPVSTLGPDGELLPGSISGPDAIDGGAAYWEGRSLESLGGMGELPTIKREGRGSAASELFLSALSFDDDDEEIPFAPPAPQTELEAALGDQLMMTGSAPAPQLRPPRQPLAAQTVQPALTQTAGKAAPRRGLGFWGLNAVFYGGLLFLARKPLMRLVGMIPPVDISKLTTLWTR